MDLAGLWQFIQASALHWSTRRWVAQVRHIQKEKRVRSNGQNCECTEHVNCLTRNVFSSVISLPCALFIGGPVPGRTSRGTLSTRREINCSKRRIHCHVIDCSNDRPRGLRLDARMRELAATARGQERVANDVTKWSERRRLWRWRRRTLDHSYTKCDPMDDVTDRQTVQGHLT